MTHKNLKVKCDKCGYNKAMVIDMSQPNAKQLVQLQELWSRTVTSLN